MKAGKKIGVGEKGDVNLREKKLPRAKRDLGVPGISGKKTGRGEL